MSDAPMAHNQSQTPGGHDRTAMRVSRLNGLEQLLGTIARHLHATGDRHSDVIAQLQDRLRYLAHAAGTTASAPELDRHLALFEAQLTSLAIRTGVQPQSLPQTPVQTAAAPMAQPPASNAPVAPPQHPMAPNQAAPSPAAPRMAPSAPSWGPLPEPTPTPDELARAAAKAEPVGAPPPATPLRDLPGLNALTRQSDLTFEDAVAEDRARQAEEAGEAIGAREEAHIFAYHPPVGKQSRPTVPPTDIAHDVVDELGSVPEIAAMDALPEAAEIIADDRPSAIAETGRDTATNHQDFDDNRAPLEDPSLNQLAMSEAAAPSVDDDLSIGALRSDLDAALSQPTTGGVALEAAPVSYHEDAPADRPEETAAADRNVDVFQEIERLSKRIDSVTTSVERIETNVEQSRNELPSLIEQAAMAAAKQTAEQVQSNDTGLNRRIDELHNLLDNRPPAPSGTPPAEPRTAATYEQELTAEALAVTANPATETRLAQAKQSMLKKLAPMGNAIARRARKTDDAPQHAPAPAQTSSASVASLEHPAHPTSTPLEHVSQPLEPQQDLSEQSISSLRKSLFQNLKDGAPPALVVVFAVVALLSGSLLLTLKSGDGEKIEQTTASLQTPQNSGTSSSLTQLDVTHSTNKMSDAAAEKVRTVGSLQQTVASNAKTDDISRPVKPTALRPLSTGAPPNNSASNGKSKLELPPLATGPLSLRVAAADGDPAAQFEVAARLAQGNGVTRDPIAAVKWYTRAASAGHARAQYRLAALYERGAGVATDTGRAKIWYTRAAQQGNVKAMHNLAVLHAGQAAGAANYVSAAQWFERAAQHGLADSQFNVAILYLNGLGVTKNLNDAYKWFALAAKQGDQEAARRLKGVTNQLTAAQRRKAEQTVKEWRARPALASANKAVAWQPKSVSRTPAPTAATRRIAPGPKVASNNGPVGPTDVKKVQRLLNGLGFDVGTPDGEVGGKTKTSIKSFQSQNGMIPTGKVDRALIGRIEAIMRERAAKLGKI